MVEQELGLRMLWAFAQQDWDKVFCHALWNLLGSAWKELHHNFTEHG